MKKRNAVLVVVAAIAALTIAPLVMAGPRGHGRGPGAHGFGGFGLFDHLAHVKDELDLTDQQVGQLKAIFAATREQNAQYRDQLHGGIKEVVEVLLANPNDTVGAQAILDRQAAAERAVKTNVLNATARALAVLNAEQRAKLATMLQEHAERRARRGR